jgi:hypothetical protein
MLSQARSQKWTESKSNALGRGGEWAEPAALNGGDTKIRDLLLVLIEPFADEAGSNVGTTVGQEKKFERWQKAK